MREGTLVPSGSLFPLRGRFCTRYLGPCPSRPLFFPLFFPSVELACERVITWHQRQGMLRNDLTVENH